MARERSSRDNSNFLNLEHEEALEEFLRLPSSDGLSESFYEMLASATVYIFYAGTLPNRTRDHGTHSEIPVISWMREDAVITPCFTSLAAIRRSTEGRATFSPIFMPELLDMLGESQLVVNPGSPGERIFLPAELALLRSYAPAYRRRTRRSAAPRYRAPIGNLEGLFRRPSEE